MHDGVIVDTDCMGRYYSDVAPECKICRDATVCKRQTTAAGYYVSPVVLPAANKETGESYDLNKVVELINTVGIPGCKLFPKKVSLFDQKDRYFDLLASSTGMVIYCSFELPGISRYSQTDPRPYRGKVTSYETLLELLRKLDAVRLSK